MKAYRTVAAEHKLPAFPTVPAPKHRLSRVLLRVGKAQPGTRRPPGTRRRSSYEKQLDRIDDLVRLAPLHGHVVVLETGHGSRRRHHKVELFGLLYALSPNAPQWVKVYRRKIIERLAWLAAHHPQHLGWARPLSKRRAAQNPDATRHYLPRRSWAAFFAWRQGYDEVVRLILTLDAWWRRGEPAPARAERAALTGETPRPSSLSPAPRSASPRPKAEERPGETESESEAGTRCRAQWALPVHALVWRALPFASA